jgi:hypothetical protein
VAWLFAAANERSGGAGGHARIKAAAGRRAPAPGDGRAALPRAPPASPRAPRPAAGRPLPTKPLPTKPPAPQVEEEDEEEEKVLSLAGALVWLACITVLISFLSDAVMTVINEASAQAR